MDHVGKMHETLACHIFCKVLSAVDFMHSQGIVHRDIKGLLSYGSYSTLYRQVFSVPTKIPFMNRLAVA